ncbi:thyrotropin-releasing hormone receptor isoform X2 [Cylas formicarius]|uniref:thyrotropin-releasing hormone receptor isoform X2 n=1 Tax=Cylas formicarius TaxID=197179 RepID=UPI0029585304|nr:thyrotropin-releasing hormone receptor isoform X2 [Cylas formicarius]
MISSIVTIATTTLNISANPLEANTTTVNYFYTTSTQELQDGGGVGNLAYNSSFNISGNVSFSIPIFPNYIRTTSMVFCIIIMCLGVIGNVMVPIVIFKTKDMRNSTNIFLVNLSVADLMVLLVCTPTVLVEVNSKPETWVLGREMCKAVPFVELTVAHASVLTILAISFERYYAICKPLKAGYICTKARASLICLLAWFIAAIFTSPILAITQYYGPERYYDGSLVFACFSMSIDLFPCMFFIGSIVIFFIFPLGILICIYALVARTLMTHPSNLIPSQKSVTVPSQSVIKYRKQVMMMLAVVVVAFFICMLPFRALTLWIVVAPAESIVDISFETRYNILYFSRIMFHINSAVNPILYNIMSSKFRGGFLKLCGMRNLRRKLRRRTETTRKSTTSSTTPSSQPTSESCLRNSRTQSTRYPNSLKEVKEVKSEEETTEARARSRNIYVRATPQIIIDGLKLPGDEIYV